MALPKLSKPFLIFLALVLILFVASMMLVDVIPPRAITLTAIGETSARIEIYFHKNKRLPPDLAALARREGYSNRTTDAWKVPLRYTVESDTTFTIESLGRDGKPGGTGDDADVKRRYQILGGEAQELPER